MVNSIRKNGDMALLIVSNLVNNGVTFLVGIIVARVLSNESFGIYSVAINVTMLMFAISEFGVGVSFVKYYNKTDCQDKKKELLRSCLVVKIVLFTILIAISAPFGWFLSKVLSPEHPINSELAIAVVCSAVLGLWAFVRALYQSKQQYKPYAFLTICYGLIRLFVAAALFWYEIESVVLYIAALYLVSPLIVGGMTFLKTLLESRPVLNKHYSDGAKDLLSYGKWITIGGILYPLCFSLPLFMLMRMADASVASQYAVGLLFVAVISPFNDAFRVFFLPKVSGFRSVDEAWCYLKNMQSKMLHYVVCLAVVVVVCVLVYSLLLVEKYPSGAWVITILVTASGLAVFGGIMNTVAHYLGLPHIDAWVNVARVMTLFLTNLWIIPNYGPVGSAVSSAMVIVLGEIVTFRLLVSRLRLASQ